MSRKKKIKVITVVGRKWFDRINGNTYHTATIYADDKVFNVPFQYGYGDQYVQSATELLEKEGLIDNLLYPNGNKIPLWQICKHKNIVLNCEASYVTRKKDL